ncbi:MAG: AmmeMemoRadiSam system protein B [Patescibacteria group bacterium]
MLTFAGISPHPPLLIPNIGQENIKQVERTKAALEKLEQELYAAKPDAVVIISPHSPVMPDAFCINIAQNFSGNFSEFGDLATKLNFRSNLAFSHRLKERLEDRRFSGLLINQDNLDHGVLVPLFYLTPHLPDLPLTPISFSLLDLKTHFDFGRIISEEIHQTNQRIAVIASGDLSHRLTKAAPAGYSQQGKVFDQKLIELLQKKETAEIISLDPALVEEAGECGLRSIIILLGILNQKEYQPEILSYEGPFGVGYLVANFKLR